MAVLILLGMGGAASLAAQELTPIPDQGAPLQITAVSAADFPQIRLRLASAAPLQPLSADLAGLRLREAGRDIEDFALAPLVAGVDLVLVVDVNQAMLVVDEEEDGRSRWQKVAASINSFASQFMRSGADRVSVIVPNAAGDEARFLAQDVSSAEELRAAVAAYDPAEPSFTTPLDAMLRQAVAHLAAKETDGRYQAILLYSNGAQLDQQLDFTALAVAAQESETPIFAAILGAQADPDEIANVTRLTEPTRGEYVHMPGTAAADAFYQLWRRHGEQIQITYRSRQNESGAVAVTVALDNRQASTRYTVEVEPPSVSIEPPPTVTRRGESAQAELAALQPAQVMVPFRVSWPDGRRRALSAVSLLVNGRSQTQLAAPDLASGGAGEIPWDVSALGGGVYTLTVRVEDDLGLSAGSDPVPVTVSLARPTPPPTASPAAPAAAEDAAPALADDSVLPIAVAGIALVLLLLTLNQWRRRQQPVPAAEAPQAQALPEAAPPEASPRPATAQPALTAYLQPVDAAVFSGRSRLRLEGDDVTLGRDAETADIVIDHESVAPLHARIKRSGDTYWLYDEGSAGGAYVDFERLGLGPRMLYDQDRVRLGRVRFIFRLQPEDEAPDAAAGEEGER